MKKLLLIALSTSLAMGANAADKHKYYAGGGVSFWEMKNQAAGDGKLNLSALEGVAGYEIFPWLAVEGRLGFGVGRERTTFQGALYNQELNNEALIDFKQDLTDTKAELNYYASLYLKPQIRNDTAIFYGLIGINTYDVDLAANTLTYTGTYDPADGELTAWEIESSTGTQGISESDTTISLGAGVGFYFKERYVVNLEYKSYIQSGPSGDTDTDLRAQGITVGVNYSF